MSDWMKDTCQRMLRTMAQTALGLIGSSVFLSDVNWVQVGSAAVLAGIVSFLMSLDRRSDKKKE